MNKIFLLIVILLFSIMCMSQENNKKIQQRIANIEKGLIEFKFGVPDTAPNPKTYPLSKRMAFYKVPGLSISVINDGKIEWTKAYGILNADKKNKVTTNSYFEAASTTKMLVAAVVLHYVEKGLLDLDTDINNYLKSWKMKENEFTKEKKVTIRLLLTHQSGLPGTNFPYEDGKIPTLLQVLNGESPAQNKPAEVTLEPGTKWQYSNIGYVVLQMLLEDITGKPLQKIMKEIIFDPLQMKSSTLEYPLSPVEKKNEAVPHDKNRKVCEPAMHPTALAQGGLMTTANDLALFCMELMKAFKGESDKIFSQKTAYKMIHGELDLNPAMFGMPLKMGLGVFILNTEDGPVFGHPGENFPGATCWLMAIPNSGKGVIIMTNSANGFPLAMEIFSAVKKVYDWPYGI